jgi:hypothetical protein
VDSAKVLLGKQRWWKQEPNAKSVIWVSFGEQRYRADFGELVVGQYP